MTKFIASFPCEVQNLNMHCTRTNISVAGDRLMWYVCAIVWKTWKNVHKPKNEAAFAHRVHFVSNMPVAMHSSSHRTRSCSQNTGSILAGTAHGMLQAPALIMHIDSSKHNNAKLWRESNAQAFPQAHPLSKPGNFCRCTRCDAVVIGTS
eukprot:2402076-Amphidinium_carterae.2